jgi:hypothetical protein
MSNLKLKCPSGGSVTLSPADRVDDLVIDPTAIDSILATPSFIGQLAVVGVLAYIAVGIASVADWKQITN